MIACLMVSAFEPTEEDVRGHRTKDVRCRLESTLERPERHQRLPRLRRWERDAARVPPELGAQLHVGMAAPDPLRILALGGGSSAQGV